LLICQSLGRPALAPFAVTEITAVAFLLRERLEPNSITADERRE
jgi:hypothetical protein